MVICKRLHKHPGNHFIAVLGMYTPQETSIASRNVTAARNAAPGT